MADVAATLELLRDLGDAPPEPLWFEDPWDGQVPAAFTRGDRRASVWCYAESKPEWACGPEDDQGDYNCGTRWGRRGFVTAEDAMRYADVQLEKEDRRG